MPDPFSEEFKNSIRPFANRAFNEIFNLDGKHWCEGCNTPSDQWAMFCMRCGQRNPHFDLRELKFDMGHETIAEAQQKECPLWHQIETEITVFKFCPFCGLDIFGQTLESLAK